MKRTACNLLSRRFLYFVHVVMQEAGQDAEQRSQAAGSGKDAESVCVKSFHSVHSNINKGASALPADIHIDRAAYICKSSSQNRHTISPGSSNIY